MIRRRRRYRMGPTRCGWICWAAFGNGSKRLTRWRESGVSRVRAARIRGVRGLEETPVRALGEHGFSLIELLIVVTIMVLIVTVAIPSCKEAVMHTREMAD